MKDRYYYVSVLKVFLFQNKALNLIFECYLISEWRVTEHQGHGFHYYPHRKTHGGR